MLSVCLKSPLTSEVDALPTLPDTDEEPEAQRLKNFQGHPVGDGRGRIWAPACLAKGAVYDKATPLLYLIDILASVFLKSRLSSSKLLWGGWDRSQDVVVGACFCVQLSLGWDTRTQVEPSWPGILSRFHGFGASVGFSYTECYSHFPLLDLCFRVCQDKMQKFCLGAIRINAPLVFFL